MAQLLDAAANVFCDVGYQAASTNAIAREAGVSPGTLYQFFPNKEALGDALSERLVIEMRNAHGTALALDHSLLTLRELIDQVIDPLIAFNLDNPVCFALIHGGHDLPSRLDTDHHVLRTAMLDKTRRILAARAPHLDQAAVDRTTDICWGVFFGILHSLFERQTAREQAELAVELKDVLYRYLAPILGEESPAARARADT